MRIHSIKIENFKAIQSLELSSISDAIVIAGPNGCGKSSVFDALRLLKSAYGSYHQEELKQWFNEFQVSVQRLAKDASRVLRDPGRPLKISAKVELTSKEHDFITRDSYGVIEKLMWSEVLKRPYNPDGEELLIDPTSRSTHGATVTKRVQRLIKEVERELPETYYSAAVEMN